MEIITVYSKEESRSSLLAINLLKEHKLAIQLKNINSITHKEIFQLIYLTGLDIPDILTTNTYSLQVEKQKVFVSQLCFSDALSFLELHPELLQSPIILSNTYALSGYNKQLLEQLL